MAQEPDLTADRFTFEPTGGYAVSAFARGVIFLLGDEQARRGRSVSYLELSQRSGVSVPTLRKLLLEAGTFELDTLRGVAAAFGISRWESLVALGKRLEALELPAEIRTVRAAGIQTNEEESHVRDRR